MRGKGGEEGPLGREGLDRRIRRTATAAALLCSVVATFAVVSGLMYLWGTVSYTADGVALDGSDVLTAFLATAGERYAQGPDGAAQVVANYNLGTPVQQTISVVAAALSLAAWLVARRMCRRVADTGRAFSAETARDLRRVGTLLCVGAVVPGALRMLVGALGWFGVIPHVVGGGMPVGTVVLDFGSLAVGALLLTMGRIFEYGCILQRQDDELL